MKQRIVAIAGKVRRYQEKADRFRQNTMFQNSQGQCYLELNQEGERCDDDLQMLKNQKDFGESHEVIR